MTCRIKVNIPPWQLANIPVAVHTHLHTLLFRYSDGLDAVIINITDVAIEQHKPPHVATFAPTVHVYAQAKLLLFQPNRGQILHGVVTKVGHDYCAIKTLGVFNATVSIRENLGDDDWCVSVFKDNAGIVTFDENQDVCINQD